MKLLNAPKHKPISRLCPDVTPNVKSLASTEIYTPQAKEGLEPSQLKLPIEPMPKLPAKQVLLPQENPFDINSELISHPRKRSGSLYLKPQN